MHSKIQQILYYAESRFWHILNNLTSADDVKLSWCQKLLHRELVRKYQLILLHILTFSISSYIFYLMSASVRALDTP